MDSSRHRGKVAVVTGAGAGIGAGIARQLAEEGASLVCMDIDPAAEAAARALGARFAQADVADAGAFAAALADVRREAGRIDILVNNAGIEGHQSPLGDYPVEAFDQLMAVNLRSVFLGMRTVLPWMAEAGGGAVVNIASIAAVMAAPLMSAYCAAKAAVVQLSKVAAVEYGSAGVRVNAVCPGLIRSRITDAYPAAMQQTTVDATPLRMMGEPIDIAALVSFLASSEARFITGQAFIADGGLTTQMPPTSSVNWWSREALSALENAGGD